MILENAAVTKERAELLAHELLIPRPKLHGKGCSIRVTDDDLKEVDRTVLDPVPTWSGSPHRTVSAFKAENDRSTC